MNKFKLEYGSKPNWLEWCLIVASVILIILIIVGLLSGSIERENTMVSPGLIELNQSNECICPEVKCEENYEMTASKHSDDTVNMNIPDVKECKSTSQQICWAYETDVKQMNNVAIMGPNQGIYFVTRLS